MIKANGRLSHTPPNTWKCYTEDGYLAANKGNISFGMSDVKTLMGGWKMQEVIT
jgi:hypothetical protein